MIICSTFSHPPLFFVFFFFNDTATTEIYTLSLHDALPICAAGAPDAAAAGHAQTPPSAEAGVGTSRRSEEHTSELQSRLHLVCRLLLEKKKTKGWSNRKSSVDSLLRSYGRRQRRCTLSMRH